MRQPHWANIPFYWSTLTIKAREKHKSIFGPFGKIGVFFLLLGSWFFGLFLRCRLWWALSDFLLRGLQHRELFPFRRLHKIATRFKLLQNEKRLCHVDRPIPEILPGNCQNLTGQNRFQTLDHFRTLSSILPMSKHSYINIFLLDIWAIIYHIIWYVFHSK